MKRLKREVKVWKEKKKKEKFQYKKNITIFENTTFQLSSTQFKTIYRLFKIFSTQLLIE